MKTATLVILKRRLVPLIVLMLLTISSLSAANESNKIDEIDENTTIDFPVGRTSNNGKEKCFALDAYKSLVIIYARYMSCESQRSYVFDLMATADEKHRALQKSANDLTFTITSIERERDAMVVAATVNAEQAEIEERRKRAWRGFAIGGLVVSLALGAVITGMGVAR